MIKQLVLLITFFLLSISVLLSCTLFGSDESGVESEDYYEDEEDEGADEAISVTVTETAEEDEDDEVASSSDISRDAKEDIYYIDEEDEDMFEGDIEVEEPTYIAEAGTADDEDYPDEEDTTFFPLDDDSVKSKKKVSTKFKKAPSKKQWISYKKIKTQPYSKAGFLVNAVYIARKGEDIKNISNKIFGFDQVNQLYAINLHLKKRNVKVGDKIYYQSSNRPQDSSQLLFYFEDKGIPPQYHQAQIGENIREIASQLLGDPNGWKEIWATNPELKSKGVLNQSVTFKYWPEGTGSGANSQLNPQPQPAVEDQPLPPQSDPNDNNDLSDDSDEGNNEQDDIASPPQVEEPIVEEPEQKENKTKTIGKTLLSEIDIILAIILAIGTIFCAIVIVKRRNKRKEFDYTATNFKIDEEE